MSKILYDVTETKFRQLTHATPISKILNTSFTENVRANGGGSTIFTMGQYLAEQREVSDSYATINALVTGGYVDFMIPLTSKTLNGVAAAYAITLKASSIVSIQADPQDANDSEVIVREKGRASDTTYIVDETLAAIRLLIPAFSSGGTFSTDAAITATGVDDTDAYLMTKQLNVISGGAANTGVELPLATGGQTVTVMNVTASVKKVYAATGDQIDDKTVTTGFILVQPEDVVVIRSIDGTNWQSDFEADAVYDTLYADTIAEMTAANGVTVDGLKIKDGGFSASNVEQKTIEVTVSRADILAMNGAAVDVVAAPGAGKSLMFHSAVLVTDFDTAAYTGGGDVSIQETFGGSLVSTTVTAANSFGNAGDTIFSMAALNAAGGYSLPVNTSLAISNATGAFTDPGTAVGVARLQITYSVHTTGL